jgi:ABC-type transport system involved in multi-copper enzyme maturation permease subunit
MMKGLLTKELLVLLRNNRTQLIIILMFIILGVFLKNPVYVMFVPLLLPMLTKQVLAVDETSKWDRYSACFPVDRKKIVASKYLVILISAVLAIALTALSFTLMKYIKTDTENPVTDLTPYLGIAVAESFILPSLAYPFDFKFGTAKGRIMYYLVTAVGVAAMSASLMGDAKTSLLSKISNPSTLALIFVSVSAVAFIISWFISTKAYESREI